MTKISRRNFLSKIALGITTLAFQPIIFACTPQNFPTQKNTENLPTNTSVSQVVTTTIPAQGAIPTATIKSQSTSTNPPSNSSPTPKPQSNITDTPAPTTKPEIPDLVVVRNGDPEPLVRKAIAVLGGMERFVKSGANVIIKPNICVAYHTYEYAATTNPWVVATLVKMSFEAGAATVRVMDYPFGGTLQQAYTKSGIEEQVKAAGGEMVVMLGMKYVHYKIPDGRDLKEANFYDDILKADVVINVPIAKQHGSTRLTLGMKNMMGIIQDREAIHVNLGQRIADITSLVRPALTVVDAVRILKANGPSGGNLNDVQKIDTVVASPDIVAADSYATSFFSLKPADIGYIVAGNAMGLGNSDLSKVKIQEINLNA